MNDEVKYHCSKQQATQSDKFQNSSYELQANPKVNVIFQIL